MDNIFTIGMTGTQLVTALNRTKIYNVRDYGVIGNGITNDTAKIQALIEDVRVTGGIIYFPAGVYLTNTITFYYNTELIGDGAASTELRSATAETLLKSYDYTGWSAPNGYPFSGVNNIKLNGNNVGTIGLKLTMVSSLNFNNLLIGGFTTYGIEFNGALIGSFNNSFIYGCNIGIYGHKHTSTLVAPNLITFNQCRIYNNPKYGVRWEDGLLLRMNYCNMENNGTTGDLTTGSIYYKAQGTGIYYLPSLHLDGCWFEGNEGINVLIEESGAYANTSTIERSYIAHDAGGTNRVGIKLTGATAHNKLYIRSTVIQGDHPIIGDGSKTVVINQGGYWDGTPQWLNEATYSEVN